MGRVAALGRRAEELIPLLPKWIDRLFSFRPRHLHVTDLPQVRVRRVEGDAVVDRSNERARGNDYVRQVGRGFDAFAGVIKSVCLAYVPEARVGDYVVVHVGFAISKVDEQEAAKVFAYLREMDELRELDVPQPE